tara:strand:+ start:30 stop:839 length:810 start_codon:yes stop_codon:yes gene_type:complete
MSIGDFLKDLAPILIGSALGPGIGTAVAGTGASPFISRAVTGAITSKLMGGKSKDAVRNALLSGIGGMAFDNISGPQTSQAGANIGAAGSGEKLPFAMTRSDQVVGTGANVSKPPVEQSVGNVKGITPRTFSGELLKSAGIGDENLLARLLNTRMGEGLTAGLIAQLLAGGDDEERPREFVQRPFGFGGPGGRLGSITYAQDGGPMAFPRRNGGIDPSEGSGTKDDVPAMLMAGEFVLTKDAVKGLGDGNQRKGIQRAYDMMDNLEARA